MSPDLTKEAIAHLWPVVQILGLFVVALGSLILALWRGFRWLQQQITTTAQAMLAPIALQVAHNQSSTKKAHKRIARLRAELRLSPDHSDEYESADEHA
jgi:endonuclease/exonuclease/phosphatase (EEP) superfamily protein YafD